MKIIYKAILLDEEGRNKLMSVFPPFFDETFYHHMTVHFNNGVPINLDDVGSQVNIKVVGYKRDDKAEAVVVQGYDRVDGKIPHITLSVAQGVKPVYSNKLVEGGWDKVNGPMLSGTVAIFTDLGWQTGLGLD